jgi:hypothetical protein
VCWLVIQVTATIDKRLDAVRGDPRFKLLLAKFMGETKTAPR